MLTIPTPLACKSPAEVVAALRPRTDGVVRSAWTPARPPTCRRCGEQLPDKEEFLGHLAEKAGLPATAWKSPDARFLVYQVEAFQEAVP